MDIRKLRKAAGLTQVELARRIGMTQSQVSRFELSADHHLSSLIRYANGCGATLRISAEVGGERHTLLIRSSSD